MILIGSMWSEYVSHVTSMLTTCKGQCQIVPRLNYKSVKIKSTLSEKESELRESIF